MSHKPSSPGIANRNGRPAPRPVQPPPLPPMPGRALPPPLPQLPAPRSRAGLIGKIAALAVLAGVSVAIGGLALPGAGKRPAAPSPGVAATEAPASERKPFDPGPLPSANPSTGEKPAVPPSTFDVPRVAPKLPATTGALALALTIDREIDKALAGAGIPASPLAGDSEFLRRIYLDLTGRIPPRDRVVAFLASDDPYKRAKLIDELLASPEYGRHFGRIWADLLVKRDFDSNKNLKTAPYVAWMAEQFNKNRPWDRVVTDMVTATGKEGEAPPTFFVSANMDNKQPSPAKLVGATGNLFMGIQVQCAECHVHPFTAKWQMKDFWGMAAFFGHVRAERALGKNNKKGIGPATIREVESLPAMGKKNNATKAILPGLTIAVPDPTDPRKTLRKVTGKFWESNKALPTGKAPYRPHLAKWLVSSENRYFAPATVNRWWAHFFARGLVNPIEDMHAENKASPPALLQALAEGFAGSGHDLQFLIRAIANSRAYQRTSRPLPENKADEKLYSHAPVKVMSAHQLLDSLAVATSSRIQAPTGKMGKGLAKAGAKSPAGTGGNPLVRFFDAREYDDDPTEFAYGIPQLLRLMNSNLTGASDVVAARLARSGDRPKVVEEMFLIALARRPSPAEVARISAYLDRHSAPVKGYSGAFWALLNSAEFISVR